MTKTHFLMGKDKDCRISTSNADYQDAMGPNSGFEKPQLDEETKANLRQSHFEFQGHPNMYTTEQKLKYQARSLNMTAEDIQAQEDRQKKMRSHNFNYGDEKGTFVSMNNATYKDFSKNLIQSGGKDGSEIRKTHFNLGNEPVPMKTVNQIEYPAKSISGQNQRNSKETARSFQSTNFKFGTDNPDKISSSHIHYHNYGFGD